MPKRKTFRSLIIEYLSVGNKINVGLVVSFEKHSLLDCGTLELRKSASATKLLVDLYATTTGVLYYALTSNTVMVARSRFFFDHTDNRIYARLKSVI